jgi:hypothetical protein
MYVLAVRYITLFVYICYHNPDAVRCAKLFFRISYSALRDAEFKAAICRTYFDYIEHRNYDRMRRDVTNHCMNHLSKYVTQR